MKTLNGVHHVTAITQDAQRNVNFYSGLLGLRLVKKTVNFDDPQSYHLYYGDAFGNPGTLLTFFVWPGASAGRIGTGEPSKIAYEIPKGSLAWWQARLQKANVQVTAGQQFGAQTLSFQDPDGMHVDLVESEIARLGEPWTNGIELNSAIRAIAGITLTRTAKASSDELYTKDLGFQEVGTDQGRRRFAVGEGASLGFLDVVEPEGRGAGRMGAGTIHHVAFRTPDDETQLEWLTKISQLGLHVSPVMDRNYFHSIYFREPAGVLFEVATDGPGFAVDEPAETLGQSLQLPHQYEGARAQIEKLLPPIHLPESLTGNGGKVVIA